MKVYVCTDTVRPAEAMRTFNGRVGGLSSGFNLGCSMEQVQLSCSLRSIHPRSADGKRGYLRRQKRRLVLKTVTVVAVGAHRQ